MQGCFAFARRLWKIKTTGKHAAGEAKCKARTGPGSVVPVLLARVPKLCQQSQSSVPCRTGLGKGLHCPRMPAESFLLLQTCVRLRHIFLLRNKRKFGWQWEYQECRGNSRCAAAPGKGRGRRGWSVRTSGICLFVKGTVYPSISKYQKDLDLEVITEQGKPGELDRFILVRG